MLKKIQKTTVLLVLLGLMTLPFARCVRNTRGAQYDDGRVYFIVDLNPDWFRPRSGGSETQGYVEIRYTIEGEEPVVSEPYQYPIEDFSGQKFDLVGRSIEGGLEVRVTATTDQTSVRFSIPTPTFKMDGNITLRFCLTEKEVSSSQLMLVME